MVRPKTLERQQYPIAEPGFSSRRARISIEYRDFSNVAQFATQLLTEHSWIWSIWLFGSRARCEARIDSDWDLALISSSYKNGKALDYRLLSQPRLDNVSEPVQCHRIPIHLFMQKRRARGHVAFAVAGEGIPLAQRNWLLPTHQPFEIFQIDHLSYQHHLRRFEKGLIKIRYVFEPLADLSLIHEWRLSGDDLLTASVILAEGLAEAGCLARELDQDCRTHNMELLAAALRRLETDEHFVLLVQSVNGDSDRHNRAGYPTTPSLRDIELAFDRIYLAFDAASDELRAERDMFVNKGDHELLKIHENVTQRIAGCFSRLNRSLKHSVQPRFADSAICEEYRQIIPYIWSRKAELVEVTSILQRRIEEIHRRRNNDDRER